MLGQVVHPGEVIFHLADLRSLWIEGAFFESDMVGLFEEDPVGKVSVVRTVAYGERVWAAELSFVNRALTGEGNVLQGWVEIQNADRALLPGMRAELSVTIDTPDEKVIAVPLRAVLPIGRRLYTFVEQGQELNRVEVQLGRRDTRYAEVLRGLFPGDQVVVGGVNEVNNAFSAVR